MVRAESVLAVHEAVERARAIAGTVLAQHASAVDHEARWPEESIRALQGSLGGLVVPTESGGQGLGLLALAQVCEALAEVCPSTAICFGMHCVGTAVIAANATEEQKQRLLRPIAEGKHLTTLALSEPGTGSHFYIPQTRMLEEPSGAFRVSGTKTFVTNGRHANSYVMSTTSADPSAAPGDFSCFLAPNEAPGMSWGPPWAGWGMRGNSATSVTLDNVLVPKRDLLGRPGDEIWYVFNVIAPYFIVAMAGTYLGIAAAALQQGREHLLKRVHGHTGAALAQTPVVQHRMGTLWAQVERTRALIYRASEKGETAAPDALLALCSAKAEVAECAEHVAAEVMSLMGGRAYREDSQIQRVYRDARAAHVMAPTTDMLRNWTGRAYLGLPLLGE